MKPVLFLVARSRCSPAATPCKSMVVRRPQGHRRPRVDQGQHRARHGQLRAAGRQGARDRQHLRPAAERRVRLPHPRGRRLQLGRRHERQGPLQSARQAARQPRQRRAPRRRPAEPASPTPAATPASPPTSTSSPWTRGPASIVGRGLIVHVQPDDYKTQPTGNAGARSACAVIQRG